MSNADFLKKDLFVKYFDKMRFKHIFANNNFFVIVFTKILYFHEGFRKTMRKKKLAIVVIYCHYFY